MKTKKKKYEKRFLKKKSLENKAISFKRKNLGANKFESRDEERKKEK